jgi:hypothetical protein
MEARRISLAITAACMATALVLMFAFPPAAVPIGFIAGTISATGVDPLIALLLTWIMLTIALRIFAHVMMHRKV